MNRRPPIPTLFPYTTLFRPPAASGWGTEPGAAVRCDAAFRFDSAVLGLDPCGVRSGHRSEEHTSELQSQSNLVCRLLLEKKKADPRKRECRGRTETPLSTSN